ADCGKLHGANVSAIAKGAGMEPSCADELTGSAQEPRRVIALADIQGGARFALDPLLGIAGMGDELSPPPTYPGPARTTARLDEPAFVLILGLTVRNGRRHQAGMTQNCGNQCGRTRLTNGGAGVPPK